MSAKPRAQKASQPSPDLARATSVLNALDSRPSLEGIKRVSTRTAQSKATIYRRLKERTFPPPIKLDDGRRSIRWISSDIDNWINERIQASRAVSPDPEMDQVG